MIQRVFRRMSVLTVTVSGIFLFAMMIHVSADVVLKYAMNKPIPGTLEVVSAYYMVAGVFLPIAAVELTRTSISVDVAYQFMPRGMQTACMVLVLAGSAAVYLVLAYTSAGDALRSFRIREVMMGNVLVSVWISRFVLPVSFLLAGAVCVYQLFCFLTDQNERNRLMAIHMTDGDL
jgi:TRAP-type C4-dicarboxylate transport system permease small subunit